MEPTQTNPSVALAPSQPVVPAPAPVSAPPPVEHHHVSFVVLLLTSLVLVFAMAGVYLYTLNQEYAVSLEQSSIQIEQLQAALQKKEQERAQPRMSPIDPKTAKVGDTVGDFTITKIVTSETSGTEISFSGTTTLRGYFGEPNMLGYPFIPFPEDSYKVPHLEGRNDKEGIFSIGNVDVYKKRMTEQGRKVPGLGQRSDDVEIVITNYVLVYVPKDAGDYADVVLIKSLLVN